MSSMKWGVPALFTAGSVTLVALDTLVFTESALARLCLWLVVLAVIATITCVMTWQWKPTRQRLRQQLGGDHVFIGKIVGSPPGAARLLEFEARLRALVDAAVTCMNPDVAVSLLSEFKTRHDQDVQQQAYDQRIIAQRDKRIIDLERMVQKLEVEKHDGVHVELRQIAADIHATKEDFLDGTDAVLRDLRDNTSLIAHTANQTRILLSDATSARPEVEESIEELVPCDYCQETYGDSSPKPTTHHLDVMLKVGEGQRDMNLCRTCATFLGRDTRESRRTRGEQREAVNTANNQAADL